MFHRNLPWDPILRALTFLLQLLFLRTIYILNKYVHHCPHLNYVYLQMQIILVLLNFIILSLSYYTILQGVCRQSVKANQQYTEYFLDFSGVFRLFDLTIRNPDNTINPSSGYVTCSVLRNILFRDLRAQTLIQK